MIYQQYLRRFEDKNEPIYTKIRKNLGLAFDQVGFAQRIAKRNPEILDLKNVTATGLVAYDTGPLCLGLPVEFTIVLASMKQVSFKKAIRKQRCFAEDVCSRREYRGPRERSFNRRWEN